ncbi:MAG TPA: hypothetical protein VF480_05120 [Verrucomicrobiae bacterium]
MSKRRQRNERDWPDWEDWKYMTTMAGSLNAIKNIRRTPDIKSYDD